MGPTQEEQTREEPVLRIIKVSRAVKKASSGSDFVGGGVIFDKKWPEQASVYSGTLPALRKPGQETFGGQVQWSGGAPAVGAPAEDGNVGGRPWDKFTALSP